MRDWLSLDSQIDYLSERVHARAALTPMTPLERAACLTTRQVPDRLQIFGNIDLEWGAHYLGFQVNRDFCWDTKKLVVAALIINDQLEFDVCYPTFNPYVVGPEGMGAQVYYPEDSLPEVLDPPVKSPADLNKLKPFDATSGRTAIGVEAVDIAMRKVGDVVPVLCAVCGPFSWAANLRGVYQFLSDLKQRPAFAHELIDICTEATKESIKAFNRVGGKPMVADATASPYLISPRMMEEFCLPSYERLYKELGPDKFSVNVKGTFEEQVQENKAHIPRAMGITNYCYQDEGPVREEVIAEGKRVAREHDVSLCIGIWGKWLQAHSPREIDDEVKRIIELIGPMWPFQVALWNLPAYTLVENAYAFVRAIKKYGTCPRADERLGSSRDYGDWNDSRRHTTRATRSDS